jgi:hypothetical protein
VLALAPFIGVNFPIQTTFSFNIGPLNIYFSMISSVAMTFAITLLTSNNKFGLRAVLMASLSGFVIIAGSAARISTIWPCIIVGFVAALINSIWQTKISKIINKNSFYDISGAYGSLLLNSLIGALVVAPVVLKIYANREIYPKTLVPFSHHFFTLEAG